MQWHGQNRLHTLAVLPGDEPLRFAFIATDGQLIFFALLFENSDCT